MTERPAARKRQSKPAVTTRARAGIEAGIEEARKAAGKALATTRRKGEALIEDTREKSFRAAAETNRLFYEHPVTAVAAAAAAGAVLGIFLPRLTIAGKAGRIAGRAAKLAVATETAQALLVGLKDVAVKNAAGKAASAVSTHIGPRRRKTVAVEDAPALTDADALAVDQTQANEAAFPPPMAE